MSMLIKSSVQIQPNRFKQGCSFAALLQYLNTTCTNESAGSPAKSKTATRNLLHKLNQADAVNEGASSSKTTAINVANANLKKLKSALKKPADSDSSSSGSSCDVVRPKKRKCPDPPPRPQPPQSKKQKNAEATTKTSTDTEEKQSKKAKNMANKKEAN